MKTQTTPETRTPIRHPETGEIVCYVRGPMLTPEQIRERLLAAFRRQGLEPVEDGR